jgi:hypothetical protein
MPRSVVPHKIRDRHNATIPSRQGLKGGYRPGEGEEMFTCPTVLVTHDSARNQKHQSLTNCILRRYADLEGHLQKTREVSPSWHPRTLPSSRWA